MLSLISSSSSPLGAVTTARRHVIASDLGGELGLGEVDVLNRHR
jgi:hypothetical protein